MTVTLCVPGPLLSDKTITARVVTDDGNRFFFNFAEDVTRQRIDQLIPLLLLKDQQTTKKPTGRKKQHEE